MAKRVALRVGAWIETEVGYKMYPICLCWRNSRGLIEARKVRAMTECGIGAILSWIVRTSRAMTYGVGKTRRPASQITP